MIDKVENFKPIDEPRMIFDYFKITKLLSKAHLELSSKVYNHLFNLKYKCLFSMNFKHTYFTISLYFNDKHYFAFTISGINQIQFTRIQQGSQSVKFIIIKLTYRAFEFISASNLKPFLLYSSDSIISLLITFYMNDFFEEFQYFENLFRFLRNHFFFRIKWVRLLLSFKKLRFFIKFIKTFEITHIVKSLIHILKKRIIKIIK